MQKNARYAARPVIAVALSDIIAEQLYEIAATIAVYSVYVETVWYGEEIEYWAKAKANFDCDWDAYYYDKY